ncbi:MAG: hypothetical protein Q9221_004255 [Calogaya cf. arnoldii]
MSKLRASPDYLSPKTMTPAMAASPTLPFFSRLVNYAYFGIILIQIILLATWIAVCLTHRDILSDDRLFYTLAWLLLAAIIHVATIIPLIFLFTWILLHLYCLRPEWFPGLMALDPWMDRERMGRDSWVWVTGSKRSAVWDDGDEVVEKGGDLF